MIKPNIFTKKKVSENCRNKSLFLKKVPYFFFSLVLLSVSNSVCAQKGKIKKAESYFSKMRYYDASLIYIDLIERNQISASEIKTYLRARLEKYKIPDVFYFDVALPIGRTGKADRGQFKSQILSGSLNLVPQ